MEMYKLAITSHALFKPMHSFLCSKTCIERWLLQLNFWYHFLVHSILCSTTVELNFLTACGS